MLFFSITLFVERYQVDYNVYNLVSGQVQQRENYSRVKEGFKISMENIEKTLPSKVFFQIVEDL